MIPNRPPQHRIPLLQSIQHRPLCNRRRHLQRNLARNLRQRPQMKWKNHANHKQVNLRREPKGFKLLQSDI